MCTRAPTLQVINILITELRFRALRFLAHLHESAERDSLSAVQRLDPDLASTQERQYRLSSSELLRRLLRQVPYWKRGHLLLGELAIQDDDIATAYAEALAAQALSGSRSMCERSELLRARCYLKRSGFEEARKPLEDLVARLPSRWDIREDLGACYIGLQLWAEAEAALKVIPVQTRSAPAQAALLYAQRKLNPGVDNVQ
jgi:tetratricopeptide (TPR) repeat protein